MPKYCSLRPMGRNSLKLIFGVKGNCNFYCLKQQSLSIKIGFLNHKVSADREMQLFQLLDIMHQRIVDGLTSGDVVAEG